MQLLPSIPELGTLEIEEVFDFYDFPRLFFARSLLGQSVLCLSVAESDDAYEWLYVPVSEDRKRLLAASAMDLRTAFAAPEGGAWRVTTRRHEQPSHVAIWPKDIPIAWLPAQGEFLLDSPSTALVPTREMSPARTLEIARRERRDITNVVLKRQSTLVEAPARIVGNLLRATQDLVDALGQVASGNVTTRGAISPAILEQTQTNAATVFAGSFGVQMKAQRSLDLLNSSLASRAFEMLFGLLSAKGNEDLLSNLLHEYKGRVAGRYRAFLEALDEAEVDIEFEWASPEKGLEEVRLTNYDVLRTIAIVTKLNEEMAEEVKLPAEIVGINLRTKSFELVAVPTQERFAGRIDPDLLARVAGTQVGGIYTAVLRKLIDISPTTGEEKVRWILIDLGPRN